MSNFARQQGLDVDDIRRAAEDVREMAAAYRELAIDVGLAAGGAVPVVGWAADVVSLGRSISKGDGWGVVFDVIGFVPLLGDAAKGGKVVDKLLALRRILDQTTAGLARVFLKTDAVAADYWRSLRNMDRYNEAMRSCGKVDCYNQTALFKGPQYRYTPTTGGKWHPPQGRGDGRWIPDDGTPLQSFLASLQPPRSSIGYKDGFPDFGEFSKGSVKIPMTGKTDIDFDLADNLWRKQTDDPNWVRPEGFTWHHKQDGVTMELVPSVLNNSAKHMGGAALFREGSTISSDF